MPESSIAYVLKGFPRMSETFIAAEIYRVEQAGIPLKIFVTKQDERYRHPVVERITARVTYLPRTTSLSHDTSLVRWLAVNIPTFFSSLAHCGREKPLGLAHAFGCAFGQAMRARKHVWSRPRGVYFKEFLHAVAVASDVLGEPDVRHLHAHFAHGATTVTWLASTILGLPFSFTAHATDIYREAVNPAGLLRRKLAAARFVVTCTEANRAYLAERAGETPVYRIYHGLNIDFTDLLAGAPSRPDRPPRACLRILSVGRLVPKKGFDVLVDACALLRRRGVPFEAVIVGETGVEDDKPSTAGSALPGSPAAKRRYADDIRSQIARLGLEGSIRLAGALSQRDLFDEYRAASVLCLACRIVADGDRDGIPNVLAEAMACGLPVVSTAVSGIPELIQDDVNGLLAPPDDPAALADALERINAEPTHAKRLATAAKATVHEWFDADDSARRLVALFRKEALA